MLDLVILSITSLIFGVVLCYVWGRVSFQSATRKVKTKISAALLECYLFRRDPIQCLKAQFRMLKFGSVYFALALPPLFALCVILVPAFFELDNWFGRRGLEPNDSVILSSDFGAVRDLDSDSTKIIGPVVDKIANQIWWRLDVGGLEEITTIFESSNLTLPIIFENGFKRIESSFNFKNQNFTVLYPEKTYNIFGFETNWIWIFVFLSFVSGLISAKYFKVTI